MIIRVKKDLKKEIKNMIAVLKNTATREQITSLIAWFEDKGLKVNESKGEYCTVLGLIGDTSKVDIDML